MARSSGTSTAARKSPPRSTPIAAKLRKRPDTEQEGIGSTRVTGGEDVVEHARRRRRRRADGEREGAADLVRVRRDGLPADDVRPVGDHSRELCAQRVVACRLVDRTERDRVALRVDEPDRVTDRIDGLAEREQDLRRLRRRGSPDSRDSTRRVRRGRRPSPPRPHRPGRPRVRGPPTNGDAVRTVEARVSRRRRSLARRGPLGLGSRRTRRARARRRRWR